MGKHNDEAVDVRGYKVAGWIADKAEGTKLGDKALQWANDRYPTDDNPGDSPW